MALAEIGLPESVATDFFAAGKTSAAAGASAYLRMDAGDAQSYTTLAFGDAASPDNGTLTVLSKAAGPSVVQRPLVIKPGGSVSVQSLVVAGVPYVPGGGGGGAGVTSLNNLSGAVTLAGAGAISVAATAQTLTISSSSTVPISGPQVTVGPGAAASQTLLSLASMAGVYMVKVDVQVAGKAYEPACVAFTAYSDGTKVYQKETGPAGACFAYLNDSQLNDWMVDTDGVRKQHHRLADCAAWCWSRVPGAGHCLQDWVRGVPVRMQLLK